MSAFAFLPSMPARAGHFIVTLYGDVVEPRGGRLAMGNLVEVCAGVGISETRVRTAVSRLVSAGKLVGTRNGRRSFYALTEAARDEFLTASVHLFEPPKSADWTLIMLAPGDVQYGNDLRAAGFTALTEAWWLGPARKGAGKQGKLPAACTLSAPLKTFGPAFQAFASERWNLEAIAAGYRQFIKTFEAIEATSSAADNTGWVNLLLRLHLVDQFRAIALGDPRLPPEALPNDWPEPAARRLFGRLYLALSDSADAEIARSLSFEDGPLPRQTLATKRRQGSLAASAEVSHNI